jgi:phosphoribosylaminoimidazolecarboxamide formyltransferase/IMP cyclohydrolase
MTSPLIRRALISVSDKLGLAEFARGLAAAGVEIYSTGGTRSHLESQGLKVVDVAAYTGFPEMMHGRLKTLHPKIFGGILCRHDEPGDMQSVREFDIRTFELVVVNLYPFQATIARPEVTRERAIENIDIGGPSLVRAAAKNHAFVTIATGPEQYAAVLQEISANGQTSLELRKRLAADAFAHTAAYDRCIADYFAREGQSEGAFAETINLTLSKKMDLRYGENPHQAAAVYREVGARGVSLVSARQLNGKELSYNNLLDLDSALGIVRSFAEPAATVIKHNNPCGAATATSLADAAKQALEGDPQSAFGGIIAFNRTVDEPTAEVLATPGLFIEAVVAPDFVDGAVKILTTKPKWKANVRLMQVGQLDASPAARHYRYIEGGMLVQDADVQSDPESEWKVVTQKQPTAQQLADLRFTWSIVRHVKSNAIAIGKDGMLLGAGAGQMSRVDSVDIAIAKAGERVKGSVLASDAFFPFADSIDKAAAAGIAAIIQPGGSVKDADVIAACNKHGLPMIFTGRRHFKH